MIVDPNAVMGALAATGTPIAPIPSIVPTDPVYVHAGAIGHRTLWVVTIIMGLSSLAFYGMAFRVPASKRLFHILTAFITTFAFLSYFAMATGDGIYPHKIHAKHHPHIGDSLGDLKHKLPAVHYIEYRDVYWARYVDWSVTTPLLLLDLALLAGLSGANILVAVVADLIMILTGLFAAYGSTEGQKWGWYTWACLAYLVIIYQLGFNGRTAAANKDGKTKAFFAAISGFTLILWTIYPIIWGVADGARIVGLDAEIVSYAILDVLAKPVFGFWLLFTHDSMASTSPSIEGFWSHGFGSSGSIRVGDDDEA